MPMNCMSQTTLRFPAKTLWVRFSVFFGLAEHADSFRSSREASNPCLQTGEHKSQLCSPMHSRVLVGRRGCSRCESIQSSCKAVPEAVTRMTYVFIESSQVTTL